MRRDEFAIVDAVRKNDMENLINRFADLMEETKNKEMIMGIQRCAFIVAEYQEKIGSDTKQAEIVYRTEYILKAPQLLKKVDEDKIRADFLENLKSGVAILPSTYTVEAHQQPVVVVFPDGKCLFFEEAK